MTDSVPIRDQESTDIRGALISDHPNPHPFARALVAVALALALPAAIFGVIGLVVAGIGYGLPLLPVMAVFLAVLLAPLLLLTVQHPRVTVYENGLRLKPLLWRAAWIPWEAVRRVEDHTLIRRGTTRAREREHKGQLIVMEPGPRLFAVVGLMAGLGWQTRAFGISTHSHRDYDALLNAIQRHKQRP